MKPLLLDTNIIVDVLRKRNDRHLLIEQFLNHGQPLASCTNHDDGNLRRHAAA